MAFLADTVLDGGLDYLVTNGTQLDICSAEPTTYTEATATYTLGNATVTVGDETDGDASGRKVTMPAITAASPGTVTASGTAAYWALTNGTSELLATGILASSQPVTADASFTMSALDITFPDV